jgi:serpin B
MMIQKGNFKYFYDRSLSERCEVLELPYTDEETSMFIVLPANNMGSRALRSVEFEITSAVIKRWVSSVRERKMTVHLPKFKVDHYFEANDYLRNLGVRNLFSGDADLSGITRCGGLSVSKVVHKAFVEVNEKGTEAAAATGMVIINLMAIPTFAANHPFLYFIYHKTSGTILFIGRIMNPKQESVE